MLVLQPVVAHTVNPSLFRKRTNAHGHDFPQLKGRLWLEGGGLCFKTTRDMFACTWRMRLSVGCGQHNAHFFGTRFDRPQAKALTAEKS